MFFKYGYIFIYRYFRNSKTKNVKKEYFIKGYNDGNGGDHNIW